MIESSKYNRENYPRKCCLRKHFPKKEEPRLNLTPGYALIGLRTTGPWVVKICQLSSCRKFIQHFETCLLWQLKLKEFFCQLVMFFTVFFHWMHKMKYSCYQQSSVIHGWFVYWIFGWEMRRLSKLEIRFRMTSFSFFTLLDAGWKVPQATLALLDSFQELHLEW